MQFPEERREHSSHRANEGNATPRLQHPSILIARPPLGVPVQPGKNLPHKRRDRTLRNAAQHEICLPAVEHSRPESEHATGHKQFPSVLGCRQRRCRPALPERLVRFIENHDEPRAAATFAAAKERAAAVAIATLTGARLFYEGQFEGRRVRLPVFLGRRPDEPVDEELRTFYGKLLETVKSGVFRDGQWNLCDCSGWADNQSFRNLVAWSWVSKDDRYLIVVNLSGGAAQGMYTLHGTLYGKKPGG